MKEDREANEVKGMFVVFGAIFLICWWFSSTANWVDKEHKTQINEMNQETVERLRQDLQVEKSYSSGLREGGLIAR